MEHSYHKTAAGHRIAYHHQEGSLPGVVFFCGYRSDMDSTKAQALAEWCAERGISYTRFDYFGHGKSEGEFIHYSVGQGLSDALEVLDHLATGEQIVVGSSMGGWIGMHAAMQRSGQVKGLVGVAAAPDFVERMWAQMTAQQRREIESEGATWVHSDYYNNDYPITKKLIENGRELLMLDHPIPIDAPVQLLQGQMDDSVPWETAPAIADKLTGDDVTVTLIKDGDHRLNRPQDLQLLMEAVAHLLAR